MTMIIIIIDFSVHVTLAWAEPVFKTALNYILGIKPPEGPVIICTEISKSIYVIADPFTVFSSTQPTTRYSYLFLTDESYCLFGKEMMTLDS